MLALRQEHGLFEIRLKKLDGLISNRAAKAVLDNHGLGRRLQDGQVLLASWTVGMGLLEAVPRFVMMDGLLTLVEV